MRSGTWSGSTIPTVSKHGWLIVRRTRRSCTNSCRSVKMKSDNPQHVLQNAEQVFRRLASVEQVSIATKVDRPSAEVQPVAPLKWLNMSGWDHAPIPERQWAIRDRVPLKQAGLFSGEG